MLCDVLYQTVVTDGALGLTCGGGCLVVSKIDLGVS